MEEREGVRLRTVAPHDRFITADDLIDGLTSGTRIVSVSLVRYDDGTLLDAARVSAACHAPHRELCFCWTSVKPAARCQ